MTHPYRVVCLNKNKYYPYNVFRRKKDALAKARRDSKTRCSPIWVEDEYRVIAKCADGTCKEKRRRRRKRK
jgi:hypothetical protein